MKTGKGVFRRLLMGLLIGSAGITPGLSGAVLAAAAGLYEPGLHAVTHLSREFKKSMKFLLPLIIGAGFGVLIFSRVIKYLMEIAPNTVIFAFLGLLAGSFPSLVKEANKKGVKSIYYLAASLAFTAVLMLDGTVATVIPAAGLKLDLPVMLLSGAVIALGSIIPGISSSFLLMQIGSYTELLDTLVEFNWQSIIWVAAGFAVTGLVFVFVVDFLFKKFHGAAYYAVIGFLCGSIVIMFPGFSDGTGLILDLLLFSGCMLICRLLSKKG